MSRPALGVAIVIALVFAGCRTVRDGRSDRPTPPARLEPTVLDYVDTDGFDGLFEASLVSQDPVIVIRTYNEKPDWEGRLNAWIAAWNMGGKVERRTVRGQFPLPGQNIDAELLREFRLLVFGVVERAEDLAKAGSDWYREDRIRSRRVALLRPYNLRFHMAEDRRIHLIFFHGGHAGDYQEFVKSLDGADQRDWSRTVECSICEKKMREVSRSRSVPRASE